MLKNELIGNISEIVSYLASADGVCVAFLDENLIVKEFNLGFMRLFNPRHNPAGTGIDAFLQMEVESLTYGQELKIPFSRATGMNGYCHCCVIKTDNGFLLMCEKAFLTESHALEQIGVMNDELINLQRELVKKNREQEKLKQELQKRVIELEHAVERIKRLEGIVSICMYCKKIRNERDIWEQMEKYISDHSDALFSHGICPVCLQQHYPEVAENNAE